MKQKFQNKKIKKIIYCNLATTLSKMVTNHKASFYYMGDNENSRKLKPPLLDILVFSHYTQNNM